MCVDSTDPCANCYRVIRVPACARVSRVSSVCPGSPRCLFTGTVQYCTELRGRVLASRLFSSRVRENMCAIRFGSPRHPMLTIVLLHLQLSGTVGQCTNTCNYSSDNYCDDGGPGAEFTGCAYGTDCLDCGPRPSRLTLCSSGCGACIYGPVTLTYGTPNQWANEYYYKTERWYSCPACSGVASGGRMYVYQGYDGNGIELNGYLWFDCSNGRWTRSVVGAGDTVSGDTCPYQWACAGPYPTGTTIDPVWSSCPYSGAPFCIGSPPPPPPTNLGPCSNTCNYASDGDCDDGGPGAEFADCSLGTDCVDCGFRSASHTHYVCNYVVGYGYGTSETRLVGDFGSELDCAVAVRNQYPLAIGASYATLWFGCFAEFGMFIKH